MNKSAFLFSFLFVSVWAKSCVHEWRSFPFNITIYERIIDQFMNAWGVYIGHYEPYVPAYIGRGFYEDALVTGRIQTSSPAGLYHIFKGKIHYIDKGVEYLVKNPSYDYHWIESSNGEYVENAIAPGYTPGREVHFVGRIIIHGRVNYGKMLPNVGMYYEDVNHEERLTKTYEILVCQCKKN